MRSDGIVQAQEVRSAVSYRVTGVEQSAQRDFLRREAAAGDSNLLPPGNTPARSDAAAVSPSTVTDSTTHGADLRP
jgi:hypothetical protein